MYGMENVYEKNHKVSGKYENDLDGNMCNLGHLAMWRCIRFSWYKEGSRLRLFKYFNAMVAKLIKIWCSNSTIFNIIFSIIIWFLSHLSESKPYEEVSYYPVTIPHSDLLTNVVTLQSDLRAMHLILNITCHGIDFVFRKLNTESRWLI